jgi:topoisomerase-4 subunit A
MIYKDGSSGRSMIKRFNILSVTRDKEYRLVKDARGSKVVYFTANPNGEAEVVTVNLTAASTARKKVFDIDFADYEIKGRLASGNIVTKYSVRKVQLKTAGTSTLGGLDIWYDEVIGRLNRDERGLYLGNFKAEDLIIVFYYDGHYELTTFEMSNRYESKNICHLTKFIPEAIITGIYQEGSTKAFFIKRFKIETVKTQKPFFFISETKNSKLYFASDAVKVQNVVKIEAVVNEGELDKPEKEDIELLKSFIQEEVEREDNQIGLFD